jgi:hypothetical protein
VLAAVKARMGNNRYERFRQVMKENCGTAVQVVTRAAQPPADEQQPQTP